jgi:hypothetical protein
MATRETSARPRDPGKARHAANARAMSGNGSIGSRMILEFLEEHAAEEAPDDLVAVYNEAAKTLILEGTPLNEHARETLVELARQVDGVDRVDDRMVVRDPRPQSFKGAPR